MSTSSCETSRCPSVAPEHGTSCSVFRETPPRQKHSHNVWATSTVSDAGLRMTVLPAASAAAIPPQGMAIGKFHGETTTTTPRGAASTPGSDWNSPAVRL